VLLGDVSPSGRLPITLPLAEEDVTPPCEGSPCHHDEGLFIGWRALIDTPVAFAFGHGLGFTTFEYTLRAIATVSSSASQQRGVAAPSRSLRVAGRAAQSTAATKSSSSSPCTWLTAAPWLGPRSSKSI